MAGLLGHYHRAEEMFLFGKFSILRRFENLFLDILLQLIPVTGAPYVTTLEERNHVAHLTREDVRKATIYYLCSVLCLA